jgi:hypothetical protein
MSACQGILLAFGLTTDQHHLFVVIERATMSIWSLDVGRNIGLSLGSLHQTLSETYRDRVSVYALLELTIHLGLPSRARMIKVACPSGHSTPEMFPMVKGCASKGSLEIVGMMR